VIVFAYAVVGGMRGITYTQVAQYCVLIVAYLIPAVAISHQMTGHVIPQIGFGATLESGPNAGRSLLETLHQIHRDLGFPEYTTAFTDGKGSMIGVFAITLTLMVGTAGLPHVLIRFYTVRSSSAARWSALWALAFIAILYTTAPAIAAFARVNLIESLHQTPVAEAPQWFDNWRATGLIQFEDKDADGLIDYGPSAATNELVIDKDIMVLANPEIANLPAWVVALVVAGGLAAALSTAAGLLMVISSSVSHDLCKSILMPNMTDSQELRIARFSSGLAVVVTGIFGIYPPAFVAEVVAYAFGLAASSFFPVLVLGVFSRRTNREGAIAGMLTGIVFTGSCIVFDVTLFGIGPKGIGMIGMVLNFVVAIVVSQLTPEPPAEMQEIVDIIRTPEDLRETRSSRRPLQPSGGGMDSSG
ncbi:MAG: VC_2705 family sodium/solute symporter, partial [Planctomycetes bacterium]|nr:VC_2705 family sodium/solute symporter [Planctomycetota bacterium]